jgi:hypothetical protein
MGSDAKDYNNDGTVDISYNNLMGQIWARWPRGAGQQLTNVSADKFLKVEEPR